MFASFIFYKDEEGIKEKTTDQPVIMEEYEPGEANIVYSKKNFISSFVCVTVVNDLAVNAYTSFQISTKLFARFSRYNFVRNIKILKPILL